MEENKVLISVICPVYNAESYVEAVVHSVLSQTFQSLELICIDDCSTDGSYEVLRRLAQEDPRLSVYRTETNMGAGNARNVGLEKARGSYITFVDADDTIEPDLYEKAFALTENGKIDEVVWGLTEEHYDQNNRHLRSVSILPDEFVCRDRAEIAPAVIRLERDTLFGYQCNSLYKASLIKTNQVAFSSALFYEDYFFNLDFIQCAETFVALPYAGYHYYKRGNASITNRFSKDYFDLSYRRVETMLAFCKSRQNGTAETYRILANKLLRYTLSALCRNQNPLSDMTRNDRKQWFLKTCALPLYAEILPRSGKQNLIFCLLKRAILKRRVLTALAMGKILFLVRK